MRVKAAHHLVAALLAAAVVPFAHADEVDVLPNGDWLNPSTWSYAAVPTSTDNVFITSPSLNTLTLAGSGTANNIFLGSDAGPTTTFTLLGGSVTATTLALFSTGQLTGTGSLQSSLINSGSIVTNGNLLLFLPAASSNTNAGTLAASGFADLTLGAGATTTTFDNTNGTIAANGDLSSTFPTAFVDISNFAISGGHLTTNAAGLLRIAGASLSQTSLAGNIAFNGAVALQNVTLAGSINQSSSLTIAGTITNNANWSLNSVITLSNANLAGSGTISLSAGQINGNTACSSLSIAAGQSIRGFGALTSLTLLNAGTIAATSASPLALTSGMVITNTGTLAALAGGDLEIAGLATTTTLTNTYGLITATGTSPQTGAPSVINITTTTIAGGRLSTDAAGEIHVANAVLNNVTASGNLFLGGTFNNLIASGTVTQSGYSTLLGNLTNNATWTVPTTAYLYANGTTSVTGSGSIVLSNSTLSIQGINFGAGTLTLGAAATITGYGHVATSSNTTLVNSGTIAATVAGKTLTLNLVPGLGNAITSLTNLGTLYANNGATLLLSGTGTLDNTAGSLLALNPATAAAPGHLSISNVTVLGGLLSADPGATVDTAYSTFNGVLINAPLITTSAISLNNVTLNGPLTQNNITAITLGGTIINNAAFFGGFSNIAIAGNVSLLGNGTLALQGGNLTVTPSGGTHLLTIGPSQTFKGFGNTGFLSFSIQNQGTISADPQLPDGSFNYTPLSLFLASPDLTFTNTGIVQAVNGGTLLLHGGSQILNNTNGIIRAVASTSGPSSSISISSVTISGGQILSDPSAANITITNAGFADLTLAGNISASGLTVLRNVTLGGSATFAPASILSLSGIITNNANVHLSSTSNLTLVASTILNGNGSLTLAGGSVTGSGTVAPTLTIGASQNLHGYATFSNFSALINTGTLALDAGGGRLASFNIPVTNNGAITVTPFTEADFFAPLTSTAGTLQDNGTIVLDARALTGPITGTGNLTVNTIPGLISDGIQVAHLTLNGPLQIRPNGTATGTSKLASLSLNFNAPFDLTNNDLIVESPNPTLARAALQSALAAGASKTSGLFSSTAASPLLLLDNSQLATPFTTFGGLPVGPYALLIAPAFVGDATLDGIVDLNDLNTVLNHLGATSSAWTDGNFDHASTIDLSDLNAVLNNLGASYANNSTVLAAQSLLATPEPASLALLLPALLLTPAARRRRGTLS